MAAVPDCLPVLSSPVKYIKKAGRKYKHGSRKRGKRSKGQRRRIMREKFLREAEKLFPVVTEDLKTEVNLNSEIDFQSSNSCISTAVNSSQNNTVMPQISCVMSLNNTGMSQNNAMMFTNNSELEILREQNQEFLVEKYSDFITPAPFPSSRVICDINHIILQARELEKHSAQCNFGGTMVLERTTKFGLVYTFYYTCNHKLCGHKEKIVTDKEKKALTNLTVLGAIATGSSFSKEKRKFDIMDVAYMTHKTYASCKKLLETSMEEEKKLLNQEEI